MRLSRYVFGTLREDPSDAESVSHRLLLRGGFIRKLAGGVYTLTPMAVRVIRKIEGIVRDEMDSIGAQEVRLPVLQPSEPWVQTGRWERYGPEMFRLRDRNGRGFCLGPTHEEIITGLVRDEVRSYRQLPVLLYQIANKYRDELRPRAGLIRAREFTMKDLYSFDADASGLDATYQLVRDAYSNSFNRCGLDFTVVEADSGLMGGDASHEYVVLTDAGEAEVAHCDGCGHASGLEGTECILDFAGISNRSVSVPDAPATVHTPGVGSVGEVAAFLGCQPRDIVKTLVFTDGAGKTVAALIRGDRTISPVKLASVLGMDGVALASEAEVRSITGTVPGFVGPVGLPDGVGIIADHSVLGVPSAVTGANLEDHHLRGVVPGRDFGMDTVADIGMAQEGDPCPSCGEHTLRVSKGIEVGHVFKLGTRYSEALGAVYTDPSGVSRPMVMGCYGIGISRAMAAAVELNHDAFGIVWPMAIAPFQVHLIPVNTGDEALMLAANTLYATLTAEGFDVLIDDRDERPGVKFKDADLIGCPIRVTIGSKALERGMVEFKLRREMEPFTVPIGDLAKELRDVVDKALA